jgi:hypothetical protein
MGSLTVCKNYAKIIRIMQDDKIVQTESERADRARVMFPASFPSK